MRKVSAEYKKSMKDSFRQRAYIMISFGLINAEAQTTAKIDGGDFTYYSSKAKVFGGKTDAVIYATLEENFIKVDGSMCLLPRKNSTASYYDTGLIGNLLVSLAKSELLIKLNTAPIDIKGLTFDFGENYPVDFDIVSDSGETFTVRNNDKKIFVTEKVFTDATQIKMIFYKMKNLHTRLRIYSILFGYGLIYYNDSVLTSTLETYVSPIGADVPQIDFSLQVKNRNRYFNPDNPDSAINFLETGQEMKVYYGYQLPDDERVEWVQGTQLYCAEWEADDYTATIRCQDVFRNMNSEFYKGVYASEGKSYYDLAKQVLAEAGQTKHYVDPSLRKIYTANPLPIVPHKVALQIIANACRCTLSQTRNGEIRIKSSFVPEVTVAASSEEKYSKVAKVLSKAQKDEYATFATNYTAVNGEMYFLPRAMGGNLLNTAYVSAGQSGGNCKFTINPLLTLTQEAACMYYGAQFVFGNALPAGITINTYNDGKLVEKYIVELEYIITKKLIVLHDFDDFDTMKIEFTKTADPFARIVLNHFSFGDLTDFTMTRGDMMCSPNAIKQELVKEVRVPCYIYQNGDKEESLLNEDVLVTQGEVINFYLTEPSYNFRVLAKGLQDKVHIKAWGNYFISVEFKTAGRYSLEIFGYRYKIVERHAVTQINERGKTVKWENPLISNLQTAAALADWLADYYTAGIEYEYDTRGNPELDVSDLVYQENEFEKNMLVSVYKSTLTFSKGFMGKVCTRKRRK